MLKSILLATTLLMSANLFADETTAPGSMAPQQVAPPGTEDISFDVTKYGMSQACSVFINSDGSLGEWGQTLIKAIKTVGTDCFYNKIDFSSLCPKYKEFSPPRKNQFLAFLFAAMANNGHQSKEEARCDDWTKGPDGKELSQAGQKLLVRTNQNAGMMLLETSPQVRYRNGRGPFCLSGPAGEDIDFLNKNFQMQCSASMFSKAFCGKKNQPGADKNYWVSLNPKEKGTSIAKRFPYCQ
jgi:hypothetical protein